MMNLFVFFIIWMAAFAVPIPPRRERVKPLPRIVTFLLGLLLFSIFVAVFTPLSLFAYWLVYTRAFLAFLEYVFTIRRRPENEGSRSHSFRRTLKVSVKAKWKIIASLFVLYLIFCIVGVAFSQIQRVNNAYYFDGFIEVGNFCC